MSSDENIGITVVISSIAKIEEKAYASRNELKASFLLNV